MLLDPIRDLEVKRCEAPLVLAKLFTVQVDRGPVIAGAEMDEQPRLRGLCIVENPLVPKVPS